MYHNAKSVRFGRETLHMMYSLRCITMLKVFDLEGKPYISYDVFSQMYHNAKSVRFGRETLHMMYSLTYLMMYSHRCITMLKVFDLEGKPYTSYDVFSQMYHNAKSVRFGRETLHIL